MAAAQSILVSQSQNPRFDAGKPSDQDNNSCFVYCVERTVNTIRVAIGQYLSPNAVQTLIDAGVNVTIQPVK